MNTKHFNIIIVLCILILATLTVPLIKKLPDIIYRHEKKMIQQNLLSDVSRYKTEQTRNAVIYYTDNDAEYITLVLQMIDTYYPLLKKDFDISDNSQVTVIIYPTANALQEGLGITYTNVPMGVFYGGVLNILSPELWLNGEETYVKKEFIQNGPIIHELVHYLVDIKTNGNYPLWFTEGVALYYENKYTNFEWQKGLKEKSRQTTYEQLKTNFSQLDELVAYRRSYDIVNFLAQNAGEASVQGIMDKLGGKGKKMSFEEAFMEQTNLSVKTIDKF